MKKFSFKNFLTLRNKITKAAILLTEGLTDIQQMIFPHIDMNSAVKFLRVMPGWKNSMLNAEIELNFSDDQKIEQFRDKCSDIFTKTRNEYLNNGFQQDIKNRGGTVTVYELTKPKDLPENLFEQFCSQMFATVMKFFKIKNIVASMRIVKRDGGKILIKSEDISQREVTWKKIDHICGNKVISDGIAAVTAGMAEMKTTKDAARKDQLKPEMKKYGDEIMAALNAIPAKSELSDEDRAKIESSTKTEESRKTIIYKGNCEECFYVYLIYLQAIGGDKNAVDAFSLLNNVYAGTQLQQIIGLNKIIETGLSYYTLDNSYKEMADSFIKNVKLIGDVSETQRKLLQMLNTLVVPHSKDWAENIDKQIQVVQAKIEKEQDAGVKAKMQQELTKLNTVKNSPQPTIQQVLGFIKKQPSRHTHRQLPEKQGAGNQVN